MSNMDNGRNIVKIHVFQSISLFFDGLLTLPPQGFILIKKSIIESRTSIPESSFMDEGIVNMDPQIEFLDWVTPAETWGASTGSGQ